MSDKSANSIFEIVTEGRCVVGFYWKGGASFVDFEGDVTKDPRYVALEQTVDLFMSRFPTESEARAETADWLKGQLDALCTALNTGTLDGEDKIKWMMNIWSLLKMGAIKNDDMNGLQYITQQ